MRVDCSLLGLATLCVTLGASGVPAAEPAVGERVYRERCAPCHGESGGGDGPGAGALQPRPRNFRDPDFWHGRTQQQLRLVVRDGKPGTLMAPFAGTLTDDEIAAVVAYLQRFKPVAK